ncbi:GNAT family N-acetyltransferase [Micromonospora chalcea]|uniref:GNAT family N-acetyltransferase n=1 Tax=Micromonospora sp. TSRI0369 TaxID=1703936 RepID=UPI0018E9BCA0|nr:GNAT family N-acetyltransferase [Micromonospora sp. TSRI0369]
MSEWVSQRLDGDHDLASFDCENEVLNDWLKTKARRAQEADTARTYVWVEHDSKVVMAYYSIAPTQILRQELTGGQAGGFSVVPAYLLARLALDRSLKGQGLGSELLVDALQVIVMASAEASGRLIVVDAIDEEAASFYRHHDFTPVKGDERRLVMKVATARKALGMMAMRVTPDHETRLISIVFEMPDGKSVPAVLSVAETRTIADRIEAAAQEALEQGREATINIREVLRDVLGRDPFSS